MTDQSAAERPVRILKSETTGRGGELIALNLLDPDTGEAITCGGPGEMSILDGVQVALASDIITHSRYHIDAIEAEFGVKFDSSRILDTLQVARKLTGERRNRLTDWAARLGMARAEFRGADEWSQFVADHCLHDAKIVAALYRHLAAYVSEAEAA